MTVALSLALLASSVGRPGTKLDDALAVSNRLLYDLPEVTTSITFATTDGATAIRNARRRTTLHSTLRVPTGLTSEIFNDGKSVVLLNFGPKTYSVVATGPRSPFEELPPLVEERFDLRLDATQGLILRANPSFSITRDERAVRIGTTTYRRLTGRHRQRRTKDQEGQAIDFRVLIDGTGLMRRAEGTAETDANGKLTFLFVCDPKVPADEPFVYDVSALKGWTKLDG